MKYLYLDQNHWIELARACHGRPNRSIPQSLVNEIETAVSSGRLAVPLSTAHFMETGKEGGADRRRRLAETMAEISRGTMIASQSPIVEAMMDGAVSSAFGLPILGATVPIFGKRLEFAFGQVENLLSSDPLLSGLLNSTAGIVYMLSDENGRLKSLFDLRCGEKRLSQALEDRRAQFRGYSRDVQKRAYIANLLLHLAPLLDGSAKKCGKTLEQLFGLGSPTVLKMVNSIPPLHVEIELVDQRDRQTSRVIQPNDMLDIAALAIAIPYCDFVVTEKLWVDLARRASLDTRYRTIIFSHLEEVEPHIAAINAGGVEEALGA